MASQPQLITLTTDFGLTDTYVGQMKGVILGINPLARIVDITHDVRPQEIGQGAFLAETAWPVFSPGAVHVAVVDPGVGTERRGLVLETEEGLFVGPDNGVLSAALPDDDRPQAPSVIAVPQDVRAFELSNSSYRRKDVSNTFHGRDVFSPAAAHLSLGVEPGEFGPAVLELHALPAFRATMSSDGVLDGRIVHIDVYGNAVTDIRSEDLPTGGFNVDVAGQTVRGPFRTFADLNGLGAIVGGSGFLGIAAARGNAAELLSVDIGQPVRLRPDG